MNDYLSGKCAHCGERKEEHRGPFINCVPLYNKHGIYEGKTFFDSGLKLLHDRAPELLQAAREVVKQYDGCHANINEYQDVCFKMEEMNQFESALEKLEAAISSICRPQP